MLTGLRHIIPADLSAATSTVPPHQGVLLYSGLVTDDICFVTWCIIMLELIIRTDIQTAIKFQKYQIF